jgi:hypothetical protein
MTLENGAAVLDRHMRIARLLRVLSEASSFEATVYAPGRPKR